MNTTKGLFQITHIVVALALIAFDTKAGIEITNGRIASTSCLLFLSSAQEKEAEKNKAVTLTQNQIVYLVVASRLDHCTRTTITNVKVLSLEEARLTDTKDLLNTSVRLTNDVIDVPFCFLGRDLAERDKLRKTLLYTETSSSTVDDSVQEDRKTLWFELRHRITGLLCQYYALHPERFHNVGKDEEIEIDGFADFVAADGIFEPKVGGYQIHKSKIYDPWGEPVHFVKNRNGDGTITARGFQHIIMRQEVDTPENCRNEKEQLGVCKHSSKGFEDAPNDCIYVDVFYEAAWIKEKRTKTAPKKK
ncbi:MAG: hypothetical protein JWM68_878 [Verrucomicrobiales bacterium]|nr:hypothetical protein [Verrucomicrobiales bacterium]